LVASLTSLPLSAAALLAVERRLSPGLLRGVVLSLPPAGVVPDAGAGVDGLAAGLAGDALAALDTLFAVDFDAAAFEAGFAFAADLAAAGLAAVDGVEAPAPDFAADDLDAADFAAAGFRAGADDLAALLERGIQDVLRFKRHAVKHARRTAS
jgi:hypothetical protein